MRIRPLLPAFAICLTALIVANFAMIPWSHRLPYRMKLDRIRVVQDPDIVFIGNSLLDGRLDADALNRGAATAGQAFRVLNAAFVSTSPPDQALLMDYATYYHPTIRTAVIGFEDFQLTEDIRFKPMELTGNHEIAVDSHFPASSVASINQWGLIERAEFRLLRLIPIVANRRNIWRNVEILRRSMGSIGMPPEATNSLGRVADFAALEPSSVSSFDEQAQAFIQDHSHFNTSYERVFADAAQHKLKVVLVVMPMSPEHRARFYSRASWQQYIVALRTIAKERDFAVIDASAWMPEQSSFIDAVHMSQRGGSDFSFLLGKQLSVAHPL